MAEVILRGVHKRFGDVQIIKGVDLEIRDHEFCVFVGPSGCGKSTLLRLIAGLEDLTSGEIRIDGQNVTDVPPSKRGLSMVFQSYALYPHMSVRNNIAFGLKMAGVPKDDIDAKVAKAAATLNLTEYLDRKPRQLSGGQRQRVAIGRAIVREPKIFLFDEPLSNLDAELRVEMRVELSKLHKRLGATMIYVTHDQVEAMTMADKIVVLRLGRIEQVGTPLDLYNAPANLFVAGFIGSPRMNFLAARVRAADAAGVEVEIGSGTTLRIARDGSGLRPGAQLTLGVRPEHLDIGEGEGAVLPATINLTEHLGGVTFFYGTLASDEPLTVEVSGQSFVEDGARVAVRLDPALCHLFDAEGKALPPAAARAKAT